MEIRKKRTWKNEVYKIKIKKEKNVKKIKK